MTEIRMWVRKVSGPLKWVVTSSPDGCDDVSPVYIRIGTARVTAESRRPSGSQRGGVGTVSGAHSTHRAAFTDGYRLPVWGA